MQRPFILRELRESHQTPADGDAAQLVQLLHHSRPLDTQECDADCYILLARWVRRTSLQRHSAVAAPTGGLAGNTMSNAAALAVDAVKFHGINHPTGAAALVFLGGYSLALGDNVLKLETLAEVVVGALLAHTGPLLVPVATLVTSGTVALFSSLAGSSKQYDIACWVLSALFQCLEYLDYTHTYLAVDALTPLYFGMRSTTLSILTTATILPGAADNHSLQGIYGIIRAVLSNECIESFRSETTQQDQLASPASMPMVAAAVLAASGMLEALARQAPPGNAPSSLDNARPLIVHLIAGLEELLMKVSAREGDLLQAAWGFAVAQTYTACRLPRPTGSTAMCLVAALFNTALTTNVLEQSFLLAASGNLDKANGAIVEYARCGMVQQATTLLGATLQHVGSGQLDVPSLTDLLRLLKQAANRAHMQYRQYIILSSQEMEGVDVRPLRAVLEKLFVASVELLATIAALQGRPQITQGALPGYVLSVTSDLQFCRSQTPQYAQLLKAAMAALPHQPHSALEVAACLPSHACLEMPSHAHGGAPVWTIDGVTAAKVQLLFAALTPCCQSLPQEIILGSFAPLSILYLRHPHPATSSAVHHALCAVLSSSPPSALETLAPLCIARWLQDESPETWNDDMRLQQLSQGLTTVVQAFPGPSAVAMLSVHSVLGKVATLANTAALTASAALFAIASQQLFHVHYTQVDEVSEALERCLRACPEAAQPRLCTVLFGLVVASDDCVRKPALARWYQNIASKLM